MSHLVPLDKATGQKKDPKNYSVDEKTQVAQGQRVDAQKKATRATTPAKSPAKGGDKGGELLA